MKKAGTLLLFMIFLRQLLFAQLTITGTVTSEDDGLALPGAFVFIKGSQNGTVTDIDGKYKITVPQGSTLVFSFVGLKSQEIQITNQTILDVVLKSDVFKMEEVVVAGVASATPKRKLSVSVNKIDSKELEAVPATSAATALQGKVAGLIVLNSSGNPGASAGIRLRGSTSVLGSSDPLIIVDGVMMDGELSDINVDDIADMQVVKGASASALYGSRAGSGVIVITTKRGNSVAEGISEIKFRNEYGVSGLVKEIKLAEHHQYRLADDYKQPLYTKYYGRTYPEGYEGGFSPDITGNLVPDFDHYVDNPFSFENDLQKEIFPSGNFYTNYVSVATNNSKSGLLTSFENNHNSGIVFSKKGSSRQNFRLNLDQKISDKFKLSSSSLVSQTVLDLPDGGETENDGGGINSAFTDALFMNPDVNLNMKAPASALDTLILKEYFIRPDQVVLASNPKYSLYYTDRKTKRHSVMQNFSLNYKTFGWLEINADYSFERLNKSVSIYYPPGFLGQNQAYIDGAKGEIRTESFSQTFQTTININQKIGDLVTKAKLCYLFEKYNSDILSVEGVDFLLSGATNFGDITGKITPSSYTVLTKAKDYFGILDLDYREKFIASMLFRMDGSSLFGPDSRWNPYYRISGAYRINEDLKIPGVQELKLRAAIGTSGQRPGFNYQYETFTVYNGVPTGLTLGNSKLKPSVTREIELGINAEFLDRFELEIIRSMNQTSGDFMLVPLPAISGFQYQWKNAATIKGTSFECTLGAQVLKTKDLKWKVNLSFDKVSQKITALGNPPFSGGPMNAFRYQAGEPFGIMYGHDWVHTLQQMQKQIPQGKTIDDFTVNSDGFVILKGTEGTRNESPIYLDQNNDNSPDYVKIANMSPDFNMSLSTMVDWKSLSLSMLWNWKSGGNIYNATKQWLFRDQRAGVNDQYGKPDYQKKTTDYYSILYDKRYPNSYFVENAGYIKLREFSIYYNFNDKFFVKSGLKFIKSAKLGLIGRNLLTFTKYTGWDPEAASYTDPTNFIVDEFTYPNYRMYTASLELIF